MSKKPLLGPIKSKDNQKINYKGSSKNLKKTFDVNKSVNFRIYVFIIIMLILMSVLIIRLFSIQIINQESYAVKLDNYTSRYQKITTPRGDIFDRNGLALATNRESLNIIYFPPYQVSDKEMWESAQVFSNHFEVDYESLTSRELKDLFIKVNPSDATAKITEEDWQMYRDGLLSDNDIYYLKLDRITSEDIATLSIEDLKTWTVYRLMVAQNSGNPNVVLNDVSYEEVAYLNENIDLFPGFSYVLDWEREYPYSSNIQYLLGSVSTTQQGLPAGSLDFYLSQGYSRNEKIGRSGLELYYEDLLSGERIINDIGYDVETEVAVYDQVQEGSKGYNLVTAIDLDLQNKVEEIVTRTIEENKGNEYRKYFDNAYFIVIDPNTGDLLSMVGMKETSDGILYNDPVSVYTDAIEPGSVVKGATLYMGLSEGIISENEYIFDTPMKIKDTPLKSSSNDLGLINDIESLSLSSNIYMFHIAIRLAGATYEYDQALNMDMSAFDTMRNYYSMFGLGIETGVDVTYETTGYKGFTQYGGNLLDYAIGQYDTYTPMQLAQYISTIANGGYRVKPRIVTGATDANNDIFVYENPVEFLSSLNDMDALERVQLGFRQCVIDGYCNLYLRDVPVEVAAKTGTAENTVENEEGIRVSAPNSSLVAYAPYDDPEVAIACAVRNAWNDKTQVNICQKMAAEVLTYYFERN